MALWERRGESAARWLATATLLTVLTLNGCGKKIVPVEQASSTSQSDTETPSVTTPAAPATTSADVPPPKDGQHESFAKATRSGDDPPPNSNPPPAQTVSGKSVYKIYKEVKSKWDAIRFAAPDGTPIHYTATLETDMGNIEIALRPDLAPNHVRNFVALARAGYYDQLFFDRICHEEAEMEPGKVQVFDSIEAGGPLGTGEPGNGSIGYWLKPEFPKNGVKVTHQPGTVGACHGIEADTAACRFYITLCDAPFLDGNFTVFGKVTHGLDIARKISQQPIREYEQDVAGSHRPDKPVTIKKVVIRTSPAEAGH